MKKIPSERQTQNRVIDLFRNELGYEYLENWQDRENNSNIETEYLTKYLKCQGYSEKVITKAIFELSKTATDFSYKLYNRNRNVYEKLRYGVQVKAKLGENHQTVHFIDWQNWDNNHFGIAEEVTIKGNHTKRPDVVLYVNVSSPEIWLQVLFNKRGEKRVSIKN
jgi:type I restriction enzyme R subunit